MAGRKARRNLGEATLRVGGALEIASVVRDLGIDPLEMLIEAGIEPSLFDDPDNLITYRARGRLMTRCVVRTGCPHFGLLVGQRMNLQSLGLVGLLARNAPTVEAALRSLVTFLHLHARGAVMDLTVDPGLATLSYDAYQPAVEATAQTGDGATAMMLNVMRTLCGSDFQPIEARFAHGKPDGNSLYLNLGTGAFLQCPIGPEAVGPTPLLRSVLAWDSDGAQYSLEGTVNGAGSALDWLDDQTGLDDHRAAHSLTREQVAGLAIPVFLNGVSGSSVMYRYMK